MDSTISSGSDTTTQEEAPDVATHVPGPPSKAAATIEQHAEDAGTPDWLLASTKAYHRWPVGKELSRVEYDAAVDKAANCSTGSLKDAQGRDTSGRIK